MGRQGWGARQPASSSPCLCPCNPAGNPCRCPALLCHTCRYPACRPCAAGQGKAVCRNLGLLHWPRPGKCCKWRGGREVLLCFCRAGAARRPPPPPRPVAAPGSRRRLRVNQPLPSLGGGPFLRGCVLCCCRWRCCRLTPRPSWQRRCRSWWRGSRWVGGQVAGWRAGWGCWGE